MKYAPERDGTLDGQWHFDFKDYKDAFDMFYRKHRMNKDYCLVVSTEFHTSGYWVERNAQADEHSTVYRTSNAVKALENRVRAARDATNVVAIGLVT